MSIYGDANISVIGLIGQKGLTCVDENKYICHWRGSRGSGIIRQQEKG